MIVTACARRLGVAAVGIVGVLAFTAGCSSSSAGKPVAATNQPAVSSAAAGATSVIPSEPASVPVTAPSSLPVSLPASLPVSVPASLPALGGKDPFCQKLLSGDLSGIGSASSSDIASVVKVWDKLAAAAPPAIKADAKAVDEYLHSVASGSPDVSKAQALGAAAQRISTWISSHCI
jgi:hypothetical protein